MGDAGCVRRCQASGNLHRQVKQLTRVIHRGYRRTLDELHHQIIWSDVIDLADVRMIQRGNRPRLALESIAELLGRCFNGNRAVEPRVPGFVHFAHTPCPSHGNDFVWTQPGTGC